MKRLVLGLLCLVGVFGAVVVASGSLAQDTHPVSVSYGREFSENLPTMLDDYLDNVTLRIKGVDCESCWTRTPIEPQSGYLSGTGDVVLEFKASQWLVADRFVFKYADNDKFRDVYGPGGFGPSIYSIQLSIGADGTSEVSINGECRLMWNGPACGHICVPLDSGRAIPGYHFPKCPPGEILTKDGGSGPLYCAPPVN